MNKKAIIPLKFLIGIILGLIIWVPTCMAISSYFRITDEALDSFNNLAEQINLMEERVQGEIESNVLIMDKKTALISFTKNSEKIEFDQTLPDAFFERPQQCESNKACLCLCREGFEREEYLPSLDHKYVCEAITCESFEDIDFPSKIIDTNFGVKHFQDYEFRGGFIVTREAAGKSNMPDLKQREVAIYLERYDEGVGLCFNPPCLP